MQASALGAPLQELDNTMGVESSSLRIPHSPSATLSSSLSIVLMKHGASVILNARGCRRRHRLPRTGSKNRGSKSTGYGQFFFGKFIKNSTFLILKGTSPLGFVGKKKITRQQHSTPKMSNNLYLGKFHFLSVSNYQHLLIGGANEQSCSSKRLLFFTLDTGWSSSLPVLKLAFQNPVRHRLFFFLIHLFHGELWNSEIPIPSQTAIGVFIDDKTWW